MKRFVYQAVIATEEKNWWYRILRTLVNRHLDQFVPDGGKILDVGCGAGYFLTQLPKKWQKWGVDIDKKILSYARTSGLLKVQMGRMESLPFGDGFFNAVVALDVLEHVRDERKGVKEMWRVLIPEGILILNVPAYQWLWSYHDVSAKHVHRYSRGQLKKLLRECGFEILRATYFNIWLLPMVIVYRWWNKYRKTKGTDVGVIRGWLGEILYRISGIERYLLRYADLPAGLSVSIVARKT